MNNSFSVYAGNPDETFSLGQINILNGSAGRNMETLMGVTGYDDIMEFNGKYMFVKTDDSSLFEKGRKYSFKAENLYIDGSYGSDLGIEYGEIFPIPSNVFSVRNAYLANMDGTYQEISVSMELVSAYNTVSYSAEFTPEKDVRVLVIEIYGEILCEDNVDYLAFAYGTRVDNPYNLNIDIESKEAGLLSGILEYIINLWRTAEAGFANIVKGITELPQKLWSLIENGLKSLFVPSLDDMSDYENKWDTLLEERFGAIYQVTNLLVEGWEDLERAQNQDNIEFPEVSINLPNNEQFTFGGYTVDIVPDGFEWFIEILKTLISIVCTIAFINGMRKKYDEIMGVE